MDLRSKPLIHLSIHFMTNGHWRMAVAVALPSRFMYLRRRAYLVCVIFALDQAFRLLVGSYCFMYSRPQERKQGPGPGPPVAPSLLLVAAWIFVSFTFLVLFVFVFRVWFITCNI